MDKAIYDASCKHKTHPLLGKGEVQSALYCSGN